MWALHWSPSTVAHLSHSGLEGRRDHPVIGEPPSPSGFFQVRSTKSASKSAIWTSLGMPGGSVGRVQECHGWWSLKMFFYLHDYLDNKTRLTIWVLCLNSLLGSQWVRLAKTVHSLHTELVLVSRSETFHVKGGLLSSCLSCRHPASSGLIQLLNGIVVNGAATIISRLTSNIHIKVKALASLDAYRLQVSAVNLGCQVLGLDGHWLRDIGWQAGAGRVDCPHAELIGFTFNEIRHRAAGLVGWHLTCLVPSTILVLLLNDVLLNGGTAVSLGLVPLEIHLVLIVVSHLQILRILSQHRFVSIQRSRLSLGIDSLHTEFILCSRAIGAGNRDPQASVRIQLLYLVVLNWGTTIILGALPLQLAATAMDIRHLDGAFRLVRLVCDGHTHCHLVLARAIGGSDDIFTSVTTHGVADHQLGVVLRSGDVDMPVGIQLLAIKGPG
ncbi:hypothetical protein E2C01_044895 [Portunus trituberculatus]|uniref:Uncharacterized protein n=1 Tax=Portunus trituberculatus TaxID=210409 RepID=A0A5B7G1Q4_PORTR|nr:hypothetical protein [Portunus trituberculatus]